jgi:hypothetical protein
LGNLAVPNWRDYDATFGAIRKTMHALLDARKLVVMLRGDHCARGGASQVHMICPVPAH